MSYPLYNILGSIAYGAALPVLHVLRSRRGGEWRSRTGSPDLLPSAGKRVWIHAASVGEITGVQPLVREILARDAAIEIVVSTQTRTGQRQAGRVPGAAGSFYLPLDVRGVVRRSLEAVDALTLLLVETEIWPNLLREAKRRGMGTAILNGRISAAAFRRYRLLRGFFGDILEHVDFFAVQSDADRQRFLELGAAPERVEVLGSSKYDAPPRERDGRTLEQLSELLGERSGLPVWVAGCVRPGEETPVLEAYRRVEGRRPHTLVLAPRHLEWVEDLERVLARLGLVGVRWTRARGGFRPESPVQVLILDTIGDLGRFYGVAALAFVGGGLARLGGHNPLEPAAFGIPVMFGPYMDNYRVPADRLVAEGGGVEVRGAGEMAAVLDAWLADAGARSDAGRGALRAVEAYRGAAGRQVQALVERGILAGGPRSGAVSLPPRLFSPGRADTPRRLVSLASGIHRQLSSWNRLLYRAGVRRSGRLGVPVVSVGNLSLGGAGKTPMVAHIATRFLAAGMRVGILSRGYRSGRRGGEPGVLLHDSSKPDLWREAGDEPWWLASAVPGALVVVGPDRLRSGRHAEQALGCEVIVLDDGFQHLQLGRDLDVVLMDSRAWTEDGNFVGPHWLREDLSALERAHVLVLTHRAQADPLPPRVFLGDRYPHLVVAECRHRPSGLRDLRTGEPVRLEALRGETVSPVSGLASPERFEETLEGLGAVLGDRWRFADHHEFTSAEVDAVTRSASRRARWIITTEKDAVRLGSVGALPEGWLVLAVDLEFISGEQEFDRSLDAVVRAGG